METDEVNAPASDGDLELEVYANLLRGRGVKATSPRVQILRYLEGREDHPHAEAIFKALKADNPSLSKTTVYNTLALLHDLGLVSVLTISGTEQRYETEKGMHHHLLCKMCGTIYDIEVACPYLGGMLQGEHKVEEVHGYFKGVCKHCLGAVPAGIEQEER